MNRVLTLFTLISLGLILGTGCVKVSEKQSIPTQENNQEKMGYQEVIRSDTEPVWVMIHPYDYFFLIPYSSSWKIFEVGISQFDTDVSSTDQTIYFGPPINGGTDVFRKYYIYRKPKQSLVLDQKLVNELSCVDDFSPRKVTIGSIQGIQHHIGGAKGCSNGFVFTVGNYTYYLYQVPPLGVQTGDIDEEMKKIIQSIGEMNVEVPM